MTALVLGAGCGSNNNDFAFPADQTNPNPLTSLRLIPGASLSSQGSQRQFTVVGTSADGSSGDLTGQVRWSSTDPRLTISEGGLARLDPSLPSGTRVTVTATVPSTGLETSSVVTVGQYLYATGGADGLDRFEVDGATGRLNFRGSTASPGNPRGLVLSPDGRFIYLTNQTAGTVTAYEISPVDGSLAPVPGSPYPAGAAPQLLGLEPSSGRLLVVSEAGQDQNRLRIYRVETETGVLSPLAVLGSEQGVGAGAQGVAFSPGAPYFFVTNRSDNTVSAFAYGDDGSVTEIEGSPYATGQSPGYGQVDPSGRFLYVTNFQGASISGFAIAADGSLSPVDGSPFPTPNGPQLTDFDDDGSHLFVGSSAGAVQSFLLSERGTLREVDRVEGLETPRALDYNPARRSLYVAEAGGQNVHRLGFDTDSGQLNLAESVSTSFERPFGLVVTP